MSDIENMSKKNEPINIMIHEIGAPLNAIRVVTDIMIADGKMNDPNMETYYVIRHACDIISSTLHPDDKKISSLHSIVDIVSAIVLPSAKLKDMSILSKPSNMNDMKKVFVPESSLRHVVMNVLCNCIKYCDSSDGKIFITYKSGVLSIWDNGSGVDVADREKIFQSGVSTSGGGLGLALSRQMMKKIGGDIKIRSGADTIFDISFPI